MAAAMRIYHAGDLFDFKHLSGARFACRPACPDYRREPDRGAAEGYSAASALRRTDPGLLRRRR